MQVDRHFVLSQCVIPDILPAAVFCIGLAPSLYMPEQFPTPNKERAIWAPVQDKGCGKGPGIKITGGLPPKQCRVSTPQVTGKISGAPHGTRTDRTYYPLPTTFTIRHPPGDHA